MKQRAVAAVHYTASHMHYTQPSFLPQRAAIPVKIVEEPQSIVIGHNAEIHKCRSLLKQLAEKEGVTEQLKAENQMLWGAGLRWRPLPKAEAPTEPTGETANEQYP